MQTNTLASIHITPPPELMATFSKRTSIQQECPLGSSRHTQLFELITDLSSRCEYTYDELSPDEQWLWDNAVVGGQSIPRMPSLG